MGRYSACIMAAGKGTRMKSDIPKVMHKVMFKNMIEHVLDEIGTIDFEKIYLLVGYKKDLVIESLREYDVEFVEQKEQLGTGHAIQSLWDATGGIDGSIVVFSGDMPLIDKNEVMKMIELHDKSGAAITLMTALAGWESDFGRIVREGDGKIIKIVEKKDATLHELSIKELNCGLYCFSCDFLRENLPKLQNKNIQGEFYLTDLIEIASKNGEHVETYITDKNEIAIGINNRIDLVRVSQIIKNRILEGHMLNGVTIIDPNTTFIAKGVQIEADTTIYPFTIIEDDVSIGSNCTVGPFVRISGSQIASGVKIENSIVRDSIVQELAQIGPFGHLRPGANIGAGAKIGNFCEVKKSIIGEKSKVNHLSYIGDTEMGANVNIGAGTITCNFDGRQKHRTIIEDNVNIGANTNLVAPIKVGRGSKTGAGTVAVRDIPENSLVVGVPGRAIKSPCGAE